MKEITESEREKLRTKLKEQNVELDGEYADNLVDPDKTALPIDAALEVEVSAVPADAFDESHYHLVDEGFVMHLDDRDASDFDREVFENWMLPLLAREQGIADSIEESDEGSDEGATLSLSVEIGIPEVLCLW